MANKTKAVLHEKCMLFPTVYAAPVQRRSEDGGKRWYNGRPDDIVSTFKAWLDEDVDGVILFHYGLMMNADYLSKEERDKNIDRIAALSKEYFTWED
jgi:hypothetical protein